MFSGNIRPHNLLPGHTQSLKHQTANCFEEDKCATVFPQSFKHQSADAASKKMEVEQKQESLIRGESWPKFAEGPESAADRSSLSLAIVGRTLQMGR
jgi:hypothetical protein